MQGLILSKAKSCQRYPQAGAAEPISNAGIGKYVPDHLLLPVRKAKAKDIKEIDGIWLFLDEAHRLRNVYKTSNVIAKTLKERDRRTSIPRCCSLPRPCRTRWWNYYGLVSIIDDPRIRRP